MQGNKAALITITFSLLASSIVCSALPPAPEVILTVTSPPPVTRFSSTATLSPTSTRPPTSTPAPSMTPTPPVATRETPSATIPAAAPTDTLSAPSVTAAPLTPTPVATTEPTPSSTPPPTSPPPDNTLGLWETQLTLNSYGWEQALVPSTPDQPYYPYPSLNRDALGGIAPHTYPAIVLENGYTRVTVVPELGGRILHWEDKLTGQRLTYTNSVLKPTNWGYRGWWFATGGIEWAFPVEEHGLNEYRAWHYDLLSGDGWRGVRVSDTDDRTGMTIAITLKLYAGRSELFIAPLITNPTGESQPLQFWMNAMLTLAPGNIPSSHLRFWVPTATMQVHSTNDGSLPGPRSVIAWPSYNGRDFSRYSEWRHYLGLFATETRGAAGAYDEGSDQGIVRSYPPTVPQGIKIFCLGDLSADLYTDDSSRYFEFWAGYNRSFFPEDTVLLAPGSSIGWEERWYPVHDIGGLGWANGELAAVLKTTGEGVAVGAYAPHAIDVSLALWQNGELRAEWATALGPAAPFRTTYPGTGKGWLLQIWQQGALLAELTPF